MTSIEVHQITKQYGSRGGIKALDGISLSVSSGEVYGLIGPDGAGKTTLFRILTSLLRPNTGQATVESLDVMKDFRKLRRIIGYMPGRFSLYQDLSVEENLTFFARIYGTTIAENYALVKDIYQQLEPFKKRRAGALSGGMKQKLALCCALIHKPKVLFLDEPTTGVDAVSRKEFWDMLQGLKNQGITIFVSTPYMDEAHRCDRIALIQNGQILTTDTPENILSKYPNELWAVKSLDMFRLLKEVEGYSKTENIYSFGEYHHVYFTGEFKPEHLMQYLSEQGLQDVSLLPTAPTIEDCFMSFMDNKDN